MIAFLSGLFKRPVKRPVKHSGPQASFDAVRQGRRTSHWHASLGGDANAVNRPALPSLRERSRYLVRNNAMAARAISVIATNTIGKGIIPSARSQDERLQAKLEGLLKAHMDTRAIDAAGQTNLYGLQRSIMRAVVESGGCLVRRRIRRTDQGFPLPFQLQVLEIDYLDTSRDGTSQYGERIEGGIVYPPYSDTPRGYYMFAQHPGSTSLHAVLESHFVPASEVAHIFRQDRPGQQQGTPWLAPVILALSDLSEYKEAEVVRQKIAACFAAFIEREDEDFDPMTQTDDKTRLPLETLEPGIVEYLKPNEKVSFGQPPQVQGYAQYVGVQHREIAMGLGIAYEALTGDLSQVNFSSARMGWLEFQPTQGLPKPTARASFETNFTSEQEVSAGKCGSLASITDAFSDKVRQTRRGAPKSATSASFVLEYALHVRRPHALR